METRHVLLLFLFFLQGFDAAPPVEVAPEDVIILEKKPFEVKCRVNVPITYCRFAVPGVSNALSLRPNLPPHEGIQYAGAGLEKGECGMHIRSVNAKNSGIIQCSMGFANEPTESTGNMTLIVAKPPEPPILQIAAGTTYGDAFMEGETIHASCKIKNARPVANISWFLGSEPVYEKLTRPVSEEDNGLFTISQNLTRKVSYVDHGKDLKCVAGHIALGQGSINHSISKLNVKFPPKPKSQELEKFGFAIGQPGRIVVTFMANPIPDIIWKVDQESLKPGTRDRTGRFEAGILQHKGAGTWDAVLNINTVRAEEVEKRYTLIAQNELGQESYKVAISTSPAPPTNITAGAIVGIVVAVLVILLLVFILIFARATGKWCFAGGVPRPVGESWSLHSAREKSPKSVRSLVYKDYTLIESEDGTRSYISPEEKAILTAEDKIKAAAETKVFSGERIPSKVEGKNSESGSDSGYEIPIKLQNRSKPGILDTSARKKSYPFQNCELGTEENDQINLPFYIKSLDSKAVAPSEDGKDNFNTIGKAKNKVKNFGTNRNGASNKTIFNFQRKLPPLIDDSQAKKNFENKPELLLLEEETSKSLNGFHWPWKKAKNNQKENGSKGKTEGLQARGKLSLVDESDENENYETPKKRFSRFWTREKPENPSPTEKENSIVDDFQDEEEIQSRIGEKPELSQNNNFEQFSTSNLSKSFLNEKIKENQNEFRYEKDIDFLNVEFNNEEEKLDRNDHPKDSANENLFSKESLQVEKSSKDGKTSFAYFPIDPDPQKKNLMNLIDSDVAKDLEEPEELFPKEPAISNKLFFNYKLEFDRREPVEKPKRESQTSEMPDDGSKGLTYGQRLFRYQSLDLSKLKSKRARNVGKIDPNPLKKMFGIRGVKTKQNLTPEELGKEPKKMPEVDEHNVNETETRSEAQISGGLGSTNLFESPNAPIKNDTSESALTWSYLSKTQKSETDAETVKIPFRLAYGIGKSYLTGERAIASEDVAEDNADGSDTESADHGSTDKSSMSKLTHEKQPKKLMNGLFGSFRKDKTKSRQTDAEFGKNPFTFDHSIKDQQPQPLQQTEEVHVDGSRTEGIVYAELDMARSPGNINVMRRDDDKTEYAEIIYPTSRASPLERMTDDRIKSRENLVASRENLTEIEESFTTTITTDGKKEAAV